MKILSVVGARPNFMKIAPFIKAVNHYNKKNVTGTKLKHVLVHTGQHYDDRMSRTFFEELDIPDADINLGIGSGSHAVQVGYSMIELEKVFIAQQPDWVVVVGDVNATLAASVTAKKLDIKVCHIEAGLRSGDITMPEEINRLVTDRLSDLLLVPDMLSLQNLLNEGVPREKIDFVGNIMIDTLEDNRSRVSNVSVVDILTRNILSAYMENENFKIKYEQNNLTKKFSNGLPFAVITLHRPSNVDNFDILSSLIGFFSNNIAKDLPIIWPIHPRTLKQLKEFELVFRLLSHENIFLLNPVGYLDMLRLNMEASLMLTDSGGLQEECTILGTNCLTLRWNTERPVTLKNHGGASVLVGNSIDQIKKEYQIALNEKSKPARPDLWDGKTAERCLKAILLRS